ncbi:MarR family winged helix-turn-helix transcriptional regulator [Sphaerimonospora cavernae]|uniref:MarR family winged helix-turn-helix transcriptional regulator n=1 Tax=Sphaerimonospora cavernae TaxID=1740611 RepID=A0ABV6UC02_9ACTN
MGSGRGRAAATGMLAETTGWLLADVARELIRRMEKALRAEGLRWREYGVLVVLEAAGPLSQQELGRRLAIDRSTMVHVIDVLEDRGLVARGRDRVDRRAYSIELTDLGRTLLADALRPVADAVQEHVIAGLTGEDRAHLNRILAQLVECIDWA